MHPDKHINKISRSVFGLQSFYSHFKTFKPEGLTWQKRVSLRKNLLEKLQYESDLFFQKKDSFHEKLCLNLLKPGSALKNSIAAISISHCSVYGGFVFSFDKAVSLGLDVELIERPGVRPLTRVSTKEEIEAAPLPASLWTAKEAAFKCAQAIDRKLTLLRECIISNWHQRESKIWRFSFQTNKSVHTNGQGILFLFENKVLTLTSIKPAAS